MLHTQLTVDLTDIIRACKATTSNTVTFLSTGVKRTRFRRKCVRFNTTKHKAYRQSAEHKKQEKENTRAKPAVFASKPRRARVPGGRRKRHKVYPKQTRILVCSVLSLEGGQNGILIGWPGCQLAEIFWASAIWAGVMRAATMSLFFCALACPEAAAILQRA